MYILHIIAVAFLFKKTNIIADLCNFFHRDFQSVVLLDIFT